MFMFIVNHSEKCTMYEHVCICDMTHVKFNKIFESKIVENMCHIELLSCNKSPSRNIKFG